MVEKIIKQCIEAGFFSQQPDGRVYHLPQDDNIICINGIVRNELGFHARPVAAFCKLSEHFGIEKAFVVNRNTGEYGTSRSSMGLLLLTATYGTPVTVVSNHASTAEQLEELNEVVTCYDPEKHNIYLRR